MITARIGVIGGTGLYDIEGLTTKEEITVETPYGKPSGSILVGTLEGEKVAFLPRHGKGHFLNPAAVPYRANIYALKSLGVERIIAVNSCGSFKEELAPGTLLIPDQIIDRTQCRTSTFFDEGMVAHIAFANPFCAELSETVYQAAVKAGAKVQKGGTYIAMEGPAFSTRAESLLYKGWGADIIGMTGLPEAKLAREAEICYAMITCVTDYDCWREHEAHVTAEIIIATLQSNVEISKKIVKMSIDSIAQMRNCECSSALQTALMTSADLLSPAQKAKLELLIGKYI